MVKQFEYHPDTRQLESVSTTDGTSYTYEYDDRGRVAKVTDKDSNEAKYAHNVDGQLVKQRFRKNACGRRVTR